MIFWSHDFMAKLLSGGLVIVKLFLLWLYSNASEIFEIDSMYN